jgi:hypothetical protein
MVVWSFNFSKNMTHKETTERSDNDMAPKDALLEILANHAKETNLAMEANKKNQPNNEANEKFGLVPEMPIYTLATMSVRGEKEYLNKLYTVNGEKITWERRGSLSIEGIHGMIDIYDTFLPSGQPYKTIYINMYGAYKSTKAPVGFVMSDSVFKPQSVIPISSITLDNNEGLAEIFYKDFLSVYNKIQETIKLNQVLVLRELLVFTVNYYKALIFNFKNYYDIDAPAIYLSFAEKVKTGTRLNLISEEFINSNYTDFATLTRKPCDWVGQSCKNYTSDEYLVSCRKTAQGRIALFLVECSVLLKLSGRFFSLDELESIVIIEHGDAAPTKQLFGATMNILIDSQNSLNNQLDHAKGAETSKMSDNSKASSVINQTQTNVTCKRCGQLLPMDSDFCHMCGAKVTQ